MSRQIKQTSSQEETFVFGQQLGSSLEKNSCILISGPLGAGKTHLIKGLCSSFGLDPTQVQSPTFTLCHTYSSPTPLHHFDLYRLNSTQEFLDRGFLDIIESEDPVFIEWPSKIDLALFKNKKLIQIDIAITGTTDRKLEVCYGEN